MIVNLYRILTVSFDVFAADVLLVQQTEAQPQARVEVVHGGGGGGGAEAGGAGPRQRAALYAAAHPGYAQRYCFYHLVTRIKLG